MSWIIERVNETSLVVYEAGNMFTNTYDPDRDGSVEEADHAAEADHALEADAAPWTGITGVPTPRAFGAVPLAAKNTSTETIASNADVVLTHEAVTAGAWLPVVSQELSQVRLLIGAEGGAITDDSIYARSITQTGNVASSNAQSRWGSYSIAFDGTGDDLRVSLASNVFNSGGNWGNQNWCFECSFRLNATSGVQCIAGTQNSGYSNTYNAWKIHVNGSTLEFFASNSGASWNIANAVNCGSVAANTWIDIAIEMDSVNDTIKIFKNGGVVATVTGATALTSSTFLQIGDFAGASPLAGYIDGIRLTVYNTSALSRYNGTAFTPVAPTDNGKYYNSIAITAITGSTGFGAQLETSTTTRFRNLTGNSGLFRLQVLVP